MEPSLSEDSFKQLPAYRHSGSGFQKNNMGDGTQNNNNRTGNQKTSVTVHACIMSTTGLQERESCNLDNDDENDNTTLLKRRLTRGLDPFHNYKEQGDRYAEALFKV